MSYVQVKNLKIVKLENGKFNVSGEFADSSVRDKNGNMIFYKSDKIFIDDFDNKNDIEFKLFKLFLDGEWHGATGKFKILDWNNEDGQELFDRDAIVLSEFNQEKSDNKNIYALYYEVWKNYIKEQKAKKYVISINKNGIIYYITKLNKKCYSVSEHLHEAKKFSGTPTIKMFKLAKLNNWIIENY